MSKFVSKFFLLSLSVGVSFIATVPSSVFSAPAVTQIFGELSPGQIVTISGSGFGAKIPAKPYLWAPFEGSANPSSLGIVTSWTGINNMEYTANEGAGGTGGLMAVNSSGNWTANITASGFSWNDYNQKMYLFRKIKRNFDIDSSVNWKDWRLWGPGFTVPDIHISASNGSVTVEGISHPNGGGWMDTLIGRGKANEYKTEEIITKSNTAADQFDALFWFYVNGQQAIEMPYQTYNYRTLKLKDDSRTMTDNFVIHGVKANTTFPDNYRYWADDVYLDTTWARVMIGNASTWLSSTVKEPLIPSAWSNTSITASVNTGTFLPGQQVYLYVIDSNGEANSIGYPLEIGLSNPSPPTVPNSAPAPQGLTVH